jgi:hypothetical protein
MEAMREAWTDERLDDLNHRVGEGFKGVGSEFRGLRLEMRTEFAAVRGEIDSLGAELRTEIRGMRAEMATLNRTMLQIGAGAVVTVALGFLSILATQI